MKRIILFLMMLSCMTLNAQQQQAKWFQEAKFGIFIHWGLYAGIGYTEWAMDHFEIQAEEYEKRMNCFNPEHFDANKWADLIKQSGATYVVVTAKHHDGFCMYDSKYTDYKITESPCKTDILKALETACRKRNIKFGIYYSVMDWHHPDYLPRRSWDQRSAESADITRYKRYFQNQLDELIQNYSPDILWFDGGWEDTFNADEVKQINERIYTLKPDILINNRLSNNSSGDFKTPESYIPAKGLKDENNQSVLWETCSTMGDVWGYNPFQNNFYSSRDLIRMLCETSSKGGNFLLNISPDTKGEIPVEQIKRLKETGLWLKDNKEAIFNTKASVFDHHPFYGVSTQKDNKIYLMLYQTEGFIRLPAIKEIQSVYYLKSGKALNYQMSEACTIIQTGPFLPDQDVSVMVVETKQPLVSASYLPKYPPDQVIRLNCFDISVQPENSQIRFWQYYQKILTDKWNYATKNDKVFWTFQLEEEGLYQIKLYASSRFEESGEMKAILEINNQSENMVIPGLAKWTSLNRGLKQPVTLEALKLPKGLCTIKLSAPDLSNQQQLLFEKIELIPVYK
ncbi:MAG TPA: alpha-L-fucosidase [Candidatus Cloacimonadota bacterium]|nr:alpha-L-fucosidase [Candidatus Cloacimonadota bacterium]